MDTRAPDNKLCRRRSVDIEETVFTAMAVAISLDFAREWASAAVITVHARGCIGD
jgi:hypothetical protein